MNTHTTKTRTAALLAAAMITLGAGTAFGAAVGTDYLSDASLMVVVMGGSESNNGYGAVSYDYSIGKYEVTNAQYALFLNTIGVTTSNNSLNLYSASQALYGLTWSGSQFVGDNRPVVYVSYYDAARFTNWLTNGGTANSSTESGLYVFDGANTLVSVPDHAAASGWVVANENEWYRAAYYNGAGGWWDYATQSNDYSGTLTASNGQNYNGSGNGNKALEAGSFINASSYFGTYDQGGNVWEWIDSIYFGTSRVVRGGGFSNGGSNLSAASGRNGTSPAIEDSILGFRVASLTAVPEPATYAALAGLAMLGWAALRRRGNRASRG
ncbi:PEP-CTERM sorting domain-containing protein [Opitutaceae bacterium TAV4]|nr:PEP-CTERM sorting domain-containing protein [Opitutaceae bacterium TAV4]RRJ98697.1 PEP-CTERM sorting domain-containing protein [Opitutaceae bacterium TAV3]